MNQIAQKELRGNLPLAGIRVAALVTDGFEESELLRPRQTLEQAGAEVMVISDVADDVQGMCAREYGSPVLVEELLEDANPRRFDAVWLPGGVVNADHLRTNSAAHDFVRAMDAAGKPIAAICHGAWLLVSAGLVAGRRLTSRASLRDDIRNAGGEWEDAELVKDKNLISSRNSADLGAFQSALVAMIANDAAHRQVRVARA